MRYVISVFLLVLAVSSRAGGEAGRFGWPLQKTPSKVIVCADPADLPRRMFLESLAGLAAQRVNQGVFDEMVWIETRNPDYDTLFRKTLDAIRPSRVRTLSVREVVSYFKKRGIVEGYVLYRRDTSSGRAYTRRDGMDESSNVATVYAAVLGGVLVDESLEPWAKELGLRMLKDVRDIDLSVCFAENAPKLDNCAALAVDPAVPNLREYAIAHKLMVYYGTGPFTEKILEWVRPLSPILGWNCGDEDEYTGAITRWGHYNTASNWCRNLAFLSTAGSSGVEPVRAGQADPSRIDFADRSSFHAYVMSDGDNMQWTMGNFLNNPSYYGNPRRESVNWTLCPVNLSVISPFTWNAIAAKQPAGSSLIEYGGGYQYPDQFALNRPDRENLLREFARRLNVRMKKLGVTVFGFICKDVYGEAAREAFRIYAEEIEGLTGMLAVQYYPYELDGGILWFPDRNGIDIPVVTARYSIWDTADERRPRAGAPEYVSARINQDALQAVGAGYRTLSWTVVHAWSRFGPGNSTMKTSAQGADPVICSVRGLLPSVKTVSADELLWRIRMEYRPEQTRKRLGTE